jgi:The GLUG motif
MLGKLNRYLTKFSILLMTVALIAGTVGCYGYYPPPSKNLEIRTWYDLDAVRDNLAGNHTLMNDLNSTTPGYEELASHTANGGKGWQPIGMITEDGGETFTGTLDGQGYVICDLFINRPFPEVQCDYVGLVGVLERGGVVKNIGAVNVTVTGDEGVGGLVGMNWGGNVSNSYSTGNVTGYAYVGGLVGRDSVGGNVSNSYSTSSVAGGEAVGGLVGENDKGTVSDSYSTGNVTGNMNVGGLVGEIYYGTVSNSYSTGNVTGTSYVGGLVGYNGYGGTVSISFWDMETSGQSTSDGGTGENTTQMQDIATFSGAGWDIIAVANSSTRNPSYIWNIVNNVTYPFLSWQPV